MAPALLETRRLSKAYPGTQALEDVSLAFEAGKVGAVIGKNGAGKSTLVKILSGAVRPSSGGLLLDGSPLDPRSPAEARARGIATVYQELSLIQGLTVGENVLFGRLPRRCGLLRAAIDWRALFDRAAGILGGMGIDLDVREKVSRLSLARRQMVEIARAMSFNARVVLLDEPTAGLARSEVDTLFALVRTLAGRGVAIVYVTHRLAELAEIADSVAALRDGRHVATVPVAEATPARIVEMMYGGSAPGPRGAAGAASIGPAVEEGSHEGAPVWSGRSAGEDRGAAQEAGDHPGGGDRGAAGAASIGPAVEEGTHEGAPAGSGRSAGEAHSAAKGESDRPGGGCRTAVFEAPPVLEVIGLSLGDTLCDVSLRLRRGEILGIAGMLGSGRTELLMCLFGAIRADRGEVLIHPENDADPEEGRSSMKPAEGPRTGSHPGDRAEGARAGSHPGDRAEGARTGNHPGAIGKEPVEQPPRGHARKPLRFAARTLTPVKMTAAGMALVPEDRKTKGLVLGLSTLDNACLASLGRVGRRGVITKRMQRAAVEPLVRELAIAVPDLEAPVSSLSGGNQQKVVIGKWLSTQPRIVLFDEPTRGIDVRAKQQVFGILNRLSGGGIASIIVSSELEELLEVCHRILVIRSGRIVNEVSPADLTLDRLFALCMQG